MSRVVKRQLKLKSRYKQRVKATIEYVKTIDDFTNLVDPRTLALYCLGPELAAYVLRTIETEEKKSKYLLWLSLFLPFFLSFPFFLEVFSFCRDDNEIQPRDVHKDEGQEE